MNARVPGQHLSKLFAESIYVIREVYAQLENPVILFSGGKDSLLLLHLAELAFAPAPCPFPLLHIDTGHNFPETIAFRDRLVAERGLKLHVRKVADTIAAGRVAEESGARPSRNRAQSVTLLEALAEFKFDACLCGGRRDEEKSRAKERFFSFRDRFGQWDPKRQRPEIWNLYNGLLHPGENLRVFPISNWTELDVWSYLAAQQVEVPSLYFSHLREVVLTDGVFLPVCEWVQPLGHEQTEILEVRFRTIGDMTCTGAFPSKARSLQEIVSETQATRSSERGGRSDDQRSASAMEDRKREGYF